MAERRMFAKTIIDSDAFLDMPVTARLLYYDLSMRADDDGFVNSPKKIMRMIGASQDDLSILALKKFIIPFDNGIVVIKHWKIHNYIRKDTYAETPYKEQKALLELDENKAYRLSESGLNTISQLPVDGSWTQDRLGKDRKGKESIGKDNTPLISPLGGKETLLDMFNRLSEDKQLSEPLKDKLREWMQYKKERKEGYKETGLKSFLTQMEKHEQRYGSSALIDCIDLCMARNYKGIITDLIDKPKSKNIDDDWSGVK